MRLRTYSNPLPDSTRATTPQPIDTSSNACSLKPGDVVVALGNPHPALELLHPLALARRHARVGARFQGDDDDGLSVDRLAADETEREHAGGVVDGLDQLVLFFLQACGPAIRRLETVALGLLGEVAAVLLVAAGELGGIERLAFDLDQSFVVGTERARIDLERAQRADVDLAELREISTSRRFST